MRHNIYIFIAQLLGIYQNVLVLIFVYGHSLGGSTVHSTIHTVKALAWSTVHSISFDDLELYPRFRGYSIFLNQITYVKKRCQQGRVVVTTERRRSATTEPLV